MTHRLPLDRPLVALCALCVVAAISPACSGEGGGSAGPDEDIVADAGAALDSAALDSATLQGDTDEDSHTGGPPDAGVVDDAGTAPPTTTACDGRAVYTLPDYHEPGPWAVGARTVTIDGLTAEVWYPAAWGSQVGKAPAWYDVREALPDGEGEKIPDDAAPWLACDCFRDLPPDDSHGPYPVLVFVHGTGAFRYQSISHVTHWASRGFVVISAEHPGLKLSDILSFNLARDLEGDVEKQLAAAEAGGGPLGFLDGLLDVSRMALSGHSAGGGAISGFIGRPGVQVLMPMAAGGTVVPDGVELAEGNTPTTLVLAGMTDGIVAYDDTVASYEASPQPRYLLGLQKAGHLAFSDICLMGAEQGGIFAIAEAYDVTLPEGIGPLLETLATDGCKPQDLPALDGFDAIHAATSMVLEGRLLCDEDAAGAWDGLQSAFPVAVGEVRAEPATGSGG
jgi:hypothetical protein